MTERDIWEEYFADAYHWTPDQVAGLPPRFLDVSPLIREAKALAAQAGRRGVTVRDSG